jgi:hypothetical protein
MSTQGNKRLSKLKDRSKPMVFIGYEGGSKAWHFYDSSTEHVHVSRDTVFEEERAWEWDNAKMNNDAEAQLGIDGWTLDQWCPCQGSLA